MGHTTTSAEDGIGGVKAVAHMTERERERGGNGWGRTAIATSFRPGPTHQREEGKREMVIKQSHRCLTRIGEGA